LAGQINKNNKYRIPKRKEENMTEEKKCPLYKKCGGCQLQNLSYAEQLGFKQRKTERLLGGFGRVEPIIGMDEPYHYRNKVQAAFATARNGKIISGVYQSGTHSIVCVDSCLTEDRKADEIIVSVRNMLRSFKIQPYDERSGSGTLRHVLVKRGFKTNQIMVVLVTAGPIFPAKNNFVKALRKEHPDITTIVHNINPYQTSLVLGERENVLYGTGKIEDELCGLTFRISPRSFYQINPVQTEVLYNTAMEYADMSGREKVIDAYCGIGTIGLVASKRAGEVIGVELNRDAVHDAISNAKRNGIKNVRFFCDDAGEFMLGMAQDGERADIVFMDPPRAGSDECFLSSLVTLAPKKIVYISCNPETQQRDLRLLTKRGYKVEKIQPVDMFPHTNHVETVVLLSQLKQKPDDYINVTIELDDVDITSAETRATYDEIKKYVAEHNAGMEVSNLYISQVKRKCGIEVGKNYNLSKNEDSRQPQCPEDKESAIVEALKHFKMIQQK
jgi:23S rRNA (uracil1939-C5)-methyltransferase